MNVRSVEGSEEDRRPFPLAKGMMSRVCSEVDEEGAGPSWIVEEQDGASRCLDSIRMIDSTRDTRRTRAPAAASVFFLLG